MRETATYLKTPALLVEQNAWHECLALQEIYAYMYSLENEQDHHRWMYKTQNEWQEMFPFWSPKMIEGVLLNLETIGYLDVMTGREGSTSKCYRINYAKCM